MEGFVDRRSFLFRGFTAFMGRVSVASEQARRRPIDLIEAHTNLGLRPKADDSLPGTWRAATVLKKNGLTEAIHFRHQTVIEKLPYDREPQSKTHIRNGRSLQAFNLSLADSVESSLRSGGFPLVVGGDCSDILGALLGLRRSGGRGLVHVDGHSDFYHPGNYDSTLHLGAAAGMDLALATGRGESTLTTWPGVAGPLVRDADVVQVGERGVDDPDYPFHEITKTQVDQITIQRFHQIGLRASAEEVIERFRVRRITSAWLHVDLDVLDESVMPAVDSPGKPGMTFAELSGFITSLLQSQCIAGADVAIYDPDLDPGSRYAEPLVSCLARAFAST